jgi:serine/threonine protein kinase/WD40 repeat protein
LSVHDKENQTLLKSVAPTTGKTHSSARYEIAPGTSDIELGRGGMGRVVKLNDTQLQREVAIKEMLNTGIDADTMKSLFIREARVMAMLEHPGVVPIYELSTKEDGNLFYAMRRIRGRTLRAAMNECINLEERLALIPHLISVANTLGFAHSKKVVHRDVKPENIMVSKFGETLVIDWGLALVGDEINQRKEVAGTLGYMSPEQARGEAVDARSDVFSFGVLMFELLESTAPFINKSVSEFLSSAVQIPALDGNIPKPIVRIVERCLHPLPSARFNDCGEVADALCALSAVKPMVRNGKYFALAAIACALLLGLALASIFGNEKKNNQQAQVENKERDVKRQLSATLAEQSKLALSSGNSQLALQLATQANQTHSNPLALGVDRLARQHLVSVKWNTYTEAGCAQVALVGTALVCATLQGYEIVDSASGKKLSKMNKAPMGYQRAIAAIDNKSFVFGGDDEKIHFASLEKGFDTTKDIDALGVIRSLDVKENNILIGLQNGTVFSHSATGQRETLSKQNSAITFVQWMQNGWLASSFDEAFGNIPVPFALNRVANGVAHNDKSIWIAVDNSLIEFEAGALKKTFRGHEHAIQSVTHFGATLFTIDTTGVLKQWTLDGQVRQIFETKQHPTSLFALSENNVTVSFENRTISQFEFPLHSNFINGPPPSAATFDRGFLFTSTALGHVSSTKLETNETLELDMKHGSRIRTLATISLPVKSDNARLITGSEDGSVRMLFWNGEVEVIYQTDSPILSLAVSPDAERVAFSSRNGNVVLYSLKFKKIVSETKSTRVNALAFSSDSLKLALARNDKRVSLISAQDGSEIGISEAANGVPLAIVFGSKNSLIAGFSNGDVLQYENNMPRQLAHLENPISTLHLSQSTLFAADTSGNVARIALDSNSIQEIWPVGGGPILSIFALENTIQCVTGFGARHSISLAETNR